MDLRETYDRIADDWHKDHLKDDWWIAATDHFISLFKPGAWILDVGCGSGLKSKYLVQHGLNVVGIDLSDKMIQIAKREAPSAKFFVMDMSDSPELQRKINKKFDGVFIQAALLHISKDKAFAVLAGLVTILKPGGYLYVAVKGSHPGEKDEAIVKENDYGYEYERFFSYFTKEEIEKYFDDLKFGICYESPAGPGKTKWIQIIGRSS
ncbi:MAG TPA: class I SAM-dependent methyltransferase [Candidatus Paceibacterota bacterium]|nr:class I SAM-dependent methyltransferase [Candidatus Paceibacterota bacterium]